MLQYIQKWRQSFQTHLKMCCANLCIFQIIISVLFLYLYAGIGTPSSYISSNLKSNMFSCNIWLNKSFGVEYCSIANVENNFILLLGVFSLKSQSQPCLSREGFGNCTSLLLLTVLEVNRAPADTSVAFSGECMGQRMWLF